jgi:thioredoxin reductase (NADPH)
MENEQVVVIGAGPAGASAAIQLQRYNIPFALLEKNRVGGLLWNANLVENYPGFPKGISGSKLVGLVKKQMDYFGVPVVQDIVLNLTQVDGVFQVTGEHSEYRPRFVVVASGTRPTPIPMVVPSGTQEKVFSEVSQLIGEHGKRIAVVGAGDAAFDYALNLTKNRNSVTILNRSKQVQCLKLLWERAMAEPGISYTPETQVSEVSLDNESGALLLQLKDGNRLKVDYLLFAIGRVPQVEFLDEGLAGENDEDLYFVGDVKNGLYRQAAIAAGDGLRAAMDIHFRLSAENNSK